MFFSVRVCACVRVHFMYEWHVLRWGPPVIQPEVRLTEQHKKSGGEKKKTTYFVGSVPLCAIITVEAGRSERGRERERCFMEEEKKMKLHLFWWLTNDFEMRVALARRQNHFPNNTAWSLNKQNWDAALTWRRDGPLSWDAHKPSGSSVVCVCVCVSVSVCDWNVKDKDKNYLLFQFNEWFELRYTLRLTKFTHMIVKLTSMPNIVSPEVSFTLTGAIWLLYAHWNTAAVY